MTINCKFRMLDEEQFNGGNGKITYDNLIFEDADYTLYDYLIDNNYADNDIDFDEEKNCILVTKYDEFVEYYDCISYKRQEEYMLKLVSERVFLSYSEREAESKGNSFCRLEDNENVFYLTNKGIFDTEKEFYFDTFEEMQKYAKTHHLEDVKVYRKKNDDDEENVSFEYELDNDRSYAYFFYELDDNDEEFVFMNDEDAIYSNEIILDRE